MHTTQYCPSSRKPWYRLLAWAALGPWVPRSLGPWGLAGLHLLRLRGRRTPWNSSCKFLELIQVLLLHAHARSQQGRIIRWTPAQAQQAHPNGGKKQWVSGHCMSEPWKPRAPPRHILQALADLLMYNIV